MSRPSDHIDSRPQTPQAGVVQPKLGVTGWLRWFWRQLTSMRTALFLLLMLAIASIPGSLVPQRTSDPNGVTQYFSDHPDLAPILDKLQAFDVYTSAWFSSIYLLLFISLIGCVIPRTKHHFQALRAKPPTTPARLARLSGFTTRDAPAQTDAATAITHARTVLKSSGYRVARFDSDTESSVSAERGYLRETGNLVFHAALVGVLVTVGFGGGYGFAGQRVLVEGQTFVNTLLAYDSFNPGRFFDDTTLDPYTLSLDDFSVSYEQRNLQAYGQPIDFTADVTVTPKGETSEPGVVKVNGPLRTNGTNIYLLGNGYAPTITVTAPDGTVVFSDSVPFLPQDANLTSLGIVKVPDGLAEQLGMIGFFYPTQDKMDTGANFSSYPDLEYPLLTLNVYTGDLGLDDGVPTSVYALTTDDLTQQTGGTTGVDSIELKPGASAELPNGLGAVSFVDTNPTASATGDFTQSVPRFASFDIHHDPTQIWLISFSALVLFGLFTGLLVPRRRVWVKATTRADGSVHLEYAGLARGDDPALEAAVTAVADRHLKLLKTHQPAVATPESPPKR
ncbi:cytochrome c biogenesis protein ResB [Cryobacterium glaciale]|uniref:Cytochrome c biogenesis protein ResB n=1 Tax=Cryobacterium glaciale TaxID=1259145 RepID=A0A4R8UQ31_9MICO|nr:cytochrome c biogenesis protein ResB [Cryobacterium glaciale]TFB67775.1 cytochrome c biogenesis protein ResB [Cryobacterium glaciale]